ncbi:MAG: 30S ribosomal protein S16 [Patescibacteria group bacterium]
MLVIRLQRIGKKHQAVFRIVLQDSHWKPQGKTLELFGFYNPHSKEKQIQAERVKFWIAKGAQPSPTLHNMFVDAGIVTGEKVKVWKAKKGKEGAAKPEVKPASAEAAAKSEPATEPKKETAVEPVKETTVSLESDAPIASDATSTVEVAG